MQRLMTSAAVLVLGCTLFTGCGSPEINFDDLVEREGVYYEKFTHEPFSGKVKGQSAGSLRKGKKDGIWRHYFEAGGLRSEDSYKGGVEHGPVTEWHENGNKRWEGTFKDGKLHGLWTLYDQDGSVNSQGTWGNEKEVP